MQRFLFYTAIVFVVDNSSVTKQLALLSPLIFMELLNMEICLFPKMMMWRGFCDAMLCTGVLVCLRGARLPEHLEARYFGALCNDDGTVCYLFEELLRSSESWAIDLLRALPHWHLRLPEDVG